ncbi:ABC transporter permease [Deinococcus pimensis]|uniref:ABC transporter permease n=1 Tax=Deinococcus pimensis TaxID=309888 RepID=UPI000482908F|nr:ABC transporter permease [Deinococcus pimensis]
MTRPEGTPTPATGAPAVTPARRAARRSPFGTLLGPLVALALLLVFNAVFTPNFLTVQTLNVNLTQVATIVIVAVGMTLVIATGGIDLSVGALMAISGAIAPMLFLHPPLGSPALGVTLAFILPVLAAGAFGLFNGTLVTRFGIQPFIATLILFIAGRGIAQVFTNGQLQTFNNAAFQYVGLGRPLGIPFQVILMVLVVALFAWIMARTVFGRQVLAVGGNEAAARLAGIPTSRVKLAVYGISGLLAGLAGLIVISINSSSDANQVGLNMELDAIAAVAVGGTALTGGRATVVGTLVGALIIQLIRYSLLARGVPDSAALVVKAVIILVAVYIQRARR